MSKAIKILALCDSPATRLAPTGFARVGTNLFTEWSRGDKAEIEIWGINFAGHGYRDIPWQIFPAGNADWNTTKKLSEFLQQLATGEYTHVWMLMDANALCVGDGEKSFPLQLAKLCKKKSIRSMLYFPVDADAFDGCEIVRAVDCAVTYTEYGKRVVQAEFEKQKMAVPEIHVLPHGLDSHFVSSGSSKRQRIRAEEIVVDTGEIKNWQPVKKPFAGPDDFLILNVNKNEWRKDPLRSLEILKGLRDAGVPAKMILRMHPFSATNGVNIKLAADQLGLVDGKDWVMFDAVANEDLPTLYGAADLYLTTTLGEGWGLGITEALGCGTPVAMPVHTSCQEIGAHIKQLTQETVPIIWMELEHGFVCGNDTRLRRRVDLQSGIERIKHYYDSKLWQSRHELPGKIREWLSWKRIAREMFLLLTKKPETKDEFI